MKDALPTIEFHGRQSFLFDADDTLWENNVLFERAADDLVTFLDHQDLSPEDVRDVLEEIGAENRKLHGYGARSFARSLRDTFARLAGVDDGDPRLVAVEQMGLRILNHEIELMPDVLPTLQHLAPQHDLYLLTKGDLEEQQLKVANSGIEDLFDGVLITPEKNTSTYCEAVDSLSVDPARTWMIGNSPRSDINPALRAGINAIFIPHPMTWRQEIEEVENHEQFPGRLLQLTTFRQLRTVFPASP